MKFKRKDVHDTLTAVTFNDNHCDYDTLANQFGAQTAKSVREDIFRAAIVNAIMNGCSETLLPGVRLSGVGRHHFGGRHGRITTGPIVQIHYINGEFLIHTKRHRLYRCLPEHFKDETITKLTKFYTTSAAA